MSGMTPRQWDLHHYQRKAFEAESLRQALANERAHREILTEALKQYASGAQGTDIAKQALSVGSVKLKPPITTK